MVNSLIREISEVIDTNKLLRKMFNNHLMCYTTPRERKKYRYDKIYDMIKKEIEKNKKMLVRYLK